MTRPEPFTTPDPQALASSRIADFTRRQGIDPADYRALHHWSVTDLEGFWDAVWEYFDIDAGTPYEQVLTEESMPSARWLSGATLNYAHHALRPHRAAADRTTHDRRDATPELARALPTLKVTVLVNHVGLP